MNLISWFLVVFCFYFSSAHGADKLNLKPIQTIVIDTSKKFQNTRVGGLSGLALQGNDLFAISDDRGRFGDPRIYRFEIKKTKSKSEPFELILKEKISLFNKEKKMPIYDFEALAGFQGGWLVSSEGDLNAKPRVNPEVLFVKDKKIQFRIDLPDEFLPKFNGKQISGLYNNKAFEGMFYDEPNKRLYLASESGLFKEKDADKKYSILEYVNTGGKFIFKKKSVLDFSNLIGPDNFYNGASDLVKISDGTFILLTRSIQASLSIQYSNILWLIKRTSDDAAWDVKSKYIINADNDKDEMNQNFEGLAIYEADGIKYLIMVSDDNFNSYEKTVFSFMELEAK